MASGSNQIGQKAKFCVSLNTIRFQHKYRKFCITKLRLKNKRLLKVTCFEVNVIKSTEIQSLSNAICAQML